MEWSVDVDPEKFLIAVAPYGGPIGEYLAHIQDTMYDAGVTRKIQDTCRILLALYHFSYS